MSHTLKKRDGEPQWQKECHLCLGQHDPVQQQQTEAGPQVQGGTEDWNCPWALRKKWFQVSAQTLNACPQPRKGTTSWSTELPTTTVASSFGMLQEFNDAVHIKSPEEIIKTSNYYVQVTG